MINTVFLDVDGVLASFRRGICNALGKSYDYATMSDKWCFWEDWPDVTFEMVNDICTFKFWQNLFWMHDGHEILRSLFPKFELEQVYLLTTPMPNLESASGKMMWVNDNLSIYLKRTIIIQAPKHLLARSNTLLIDDKDKNIDKFIEAGGRGLLVPRPYNRAHLQANRTVEVVKEFLENFLFLLISINLFFVNVVFKKKLITIL